MSIKLSKIPQISPKYDQNILKTFQNLILINRIPQILLLMLYLSHFLKIIIKLHDIIPISLLINHLSAKPIS
jgi:hypothetical protein